MSFNHCLHISSSSSYILIIIVLINLITIAISQKDCSDLQNGDTLQDGDIITLNQDCVINTTSIININDIGITIDGGNYKIEFITTQEYLFEISNDASLTIQNVEIQSPKKYTSTTANSSLESIFYLSSASSLTLNNVQFVNNIVNDNDYIYTEYIIYSPQSDKSSSINIQQSSFQTNFAILTDAIYVEGTKNIETCPSDNPCCDSIISITDSIYNDLSTVKLYFCTLNAIPISCICYNLTQFVVTRILIYFVLLYLVIFDSVLQ